MTVPAECRRCGRGPCTSKPPAVEPPALRPVEPEPAADEPDMLQALLTDLLEFLGDRPRSDAAAMALYRRVLEMLGEQER